MSLQKNLKVALLAPITHNIPPVGYGPWELMIYNLAESLVKMNVDVTVFATKQAQSSAKIDYLIDDPLENYVNELHQSFTEKHIDYVLSKAADFDIIHNHLNIHPVLLAKTIRTPMVTTLHGSAIEKDNASYYEKCKNENFISISYAERTFMPKLNYVGNVYNGVDFRKYRIRKGAGKYFVFNGRIVKEKGILNAIELSKKTSIPLKIAGIITNQDFFDNEIVPHLDNSLISFVGNLEYSKLVSLLQDAIATICLVEWEEPFGLSALDSLACGVPVIATKRGALPELIYDENMGIIVDGVTQAIERLGEIRKIDSKICSNLAQRKFSQEVMAKDYLQNYLNLIK